MKKNIFDILKERGYISQTIDDKKLEEILTQKKVNFYIGFDPTANSLHVGHFVALMVVKYLQDAGHKPYILIGGGTGFVGDPSGRIEMRKMIDKKTIKFNCNCFKKQMRNFVKFGKTKNRAEIVNNINWLKKLRWIDFLREISIYFSVNKMLTAEVFKARLEHGLSFFEFNYTLMQSYDYLYLNRKYDVELQIGGNDQWFNILNGINLIRKKTQKEVSGFTITILTKSDGQKMGKTSSGAIWLDPNKTSPYDFYQYWLNIDDKDVEICFKLLTTIDLETIKNFISKKNKEFQEVKKILAYEITKRVHGKTEADKVCKQSIAAFYTNNVEEMLTKKVNLTVETKIVDLLVYIKLVNSKTEARALIKNKGIKINDSIVLNQYDTISTYTNSNTFVLHKGKKVRLNINLLN